MTLNTVISVASFLLYVELRFYSRLSVCLVAAPAPAPAPGTGPRVKLDTYYSPQPGRGPTKGPRAARRVLS